MNFAKIKIKNDKISWIVFALLCGISLSLIMISCATIISGTKQKIGVSSSPVGASVTVDNEYKGKTPLVLKLKRKANHLVKIDMPGYQSFEAKLTKDVNLWFFGNILVGGLIGIVVDAATGAMYRLTPETGTLPRQDLAGEKDVMTIYTVLNADPSWEKIGNLTPSAPQVPSSSLQTEQQTPPLQQAPTPTTDGPTMIPASQVPDALRPK